MINSTPLIVIDEHDPEHDLYVIALVDVHDVDSYTDGVADYFGKYTASDDFRATEVYFIWQ